MQLAAAEQHTIECMVATLVYAKTPSASYICPLRIYDNRCPIDEYLFDRHSLSKGESFLHVSSIIAPRALIARYPFRNLRMYEDYTFLLDAIKLGQMQIITVKEPLTVVHLEQS